MLKKRRLKRSGPRSVRVGDLVHAWDCNKPLSMDASDDDGHTMGYVRTIANDHIEVELGGDVVKCWKNPVLVIRRFAARLRYYLDEKLVRFRPGSSACGGADAREETLHHRVHGPHPGPATTRLAMRFLGEDRLNHSGITFKKIIKEKDEWFFGQSDGGADLELTFKIISCLEVRWPKRRVAAK